MMIDFTALLRELKTGSKTLSREEFRILVLTFYDAQENRKRSRNQIRAMSDTRPILLPTIANFNEDMEAQIEKILAWYVQNDPLGAWCIAQRGVSTKYAANLLAHIRFETYRKIRTDEGLVIMKDDNGNEVTERVQTPSRVWAFAGLDPTRKMEKGQRRPWNARLKTVCHLIGDSFTRLHKGYEYESKTTGRTIKVEPSWWGQLFLDRWTYEKEMNENRAFADQAASILREWPNHKQAKTYADGRLPAGHILKRAQRWTVKMFLSCYHYVGYCIEFGEEPPKPYAIAILKHSDEIVPPGMRDYARGFLRRKAI